MSSVVCMAQSSDNGDGTFTNPVLWADLPDPDVTQVGDTFYFVSTSMHMLPGATILKSTDLVNWEFAANVVPQFDDDPYFDMQCGNRYGRGQWATALRYWNDECHVLFTSNSNGTFIYSSPTMQGKWRKTVLYDGPYHPLIDRFKPLKEQKKGDNFYHHILYDPGFLVDNDGRVYVVHGNSINYITEIDPVTLQEKSPAKFLYKAHREGLEGNRPYHIGDYYYIICTYGGNHSGNVQCLRSKSLDGPWEEREVMCSGARMADSHILQACLIPLKSGETWAMAFLDMGVLGRIPHLVPVHWIDGWPIFGDWANGNITLSKPLIDNGNHKPQISNLKSRILATSDDFSSNKLGLQWQFNHNPDNSAWSLTERPGWLRLHSLEANQSLPKNCAKNPLINNSEEISNSSIEVGKDAPFLMARNTLTQRMFGPESSMTIKVDASHLKQGDRAGLAVLNIPYATLTITKSSKGYEIAQTVGDNHNERTAETSSCRGVFWLRSTADGIRGIADFSYSKDGKTFTSLGKTFKMEYSGSYFVGNRFAIFCYNTKGNGGYFDIDDCKVGIKPLFDKHVRLGSVLRAEWTDALWRTELVTAPYNGVAGEEASVSCFADGGMIAFNNLQYSGNISTLSFRLKNISTHNTFIELKDDVTQEVLGTTDVPEPSDDFINVNMKLTKPLTSGHRLCIRIWNKDWNKTDFGKILLDKITFEQ